MNINSDVNILGSLSDWNLISWVASKNEDFTINKADKHQFTTIKTTKSLTTNLKVIKDNFLILKESNCQNLILSILRADGISKDSLIALFWSASANNELLFHLNEKVYFPAFYSGRVSIKNDEVIACLKELRQTEEQLKKWSDSTIATTASKYLTLLKKFGLMEGTQNKNIVHPYLSDSLFILFVYWIAAITQKPNLLGNEWLNYCFSEKQAFLDRLLQKKFTKFFNVIYTGDKLHLEPVISYDTIYEHSTKS